MELTGKCKQDFEKWLYSNRSKYIMFALYDYFNFIQLPHSIQYGVYVDFFDSVGIVIDVSPNSYEKSRIGDGFEWWISKESGSVNDFTPRTRPEARTKAIEKANEIYNSN